MLRVGPWHCPTQYTTDFSLQENLKTFEQNIWFPMKSAFRLSGSQLTITLAPAQWPQAPVSCFASGQQCNAWNQYKSFVSLSSFISCSSSLEIGLRRLTCWHAHIRFCNSIYATFSECRTGKYISGEDPAESAAFVCMCDIRSVASLRRHCDILGRMVRESDTSISAAARRQQLYAEKFWK